MDKIPPDLKAEIFSIFGILGSAWLVSNVLSTNERSLFDRIFKRYNKINNIYQLLPILQKNSKRLFLFFSDLTTSIKSVLSPNDVTITRQMVEGILSHEYYKNKIIEVQNEVFKEFNVDYKEVEEAIKRFSQDDQVDFYVSGVMRMYEAVLDCTYPQCPGVEPNREITLSKYFEILERVTISETKRWIQKQPGSIGNWETDETKMVNRLNTRPSTRLNTSTSVEEKRASVKRVNSNTDTSSSCGKNSVTSDLSHNEYLPSKDMSRSSSKGRSTGKFSFKVGKGKLASSLINNNSNEVRVEEEIKNNRELQNIIMRELSKYGYDNYLDALVALKTSENYFCYFPSFKASKMAIASKVKRVYNSSDVQKVTRHELELILETSENDTLVLVLIFDDLINESSFNKLVKVSTSQTPIHELNKQFNLTYQAVLNVNKNGVTNAVDCSSTINGMNSVNSSEGADGSNIDNGGGEGNSNSDNGVGVGESGTNKGDVNVGSNEGVNIVSTNEINNTNDKEEVEGREGISDSNDAMGLEISSGRNSDGQSNDDGKVLNLVLNAVTSKEVDVINAIERGIQATNDQKYKVVTVWVFKEEFIGPLKMQTFPALAIFKSGSIEEMISI